jgi:hypothetical protein
MISNNLVISLPLERTSNQSRQRPRRCFIVANDIATLRMDRWLAVDFPLPSREILVPMHKTVFQTRDHDIC